MEISPIVWDGAVLRLLDQRLLPEREVYITCRNLADVAACIKDMVVRGAPAIGVTAAYGIVLALKGLDIPPANPLANRNYYTDNLSEAAALLEATRPTAVNLDWAVKRMLKKYEIIAGEGPERIEREMEAEANRIFEEDIAINKRIGDYGAELLKDGSTVLTHCNAGALATAGYGTALGVFRSASRQGKNISVYADETRPYLQGARLTAWELQKERIPVTLIVDSAAGYYMHKKMVHAVITGADRVAANGDTANKIGTYMLAVLAKENNIPFYVALPFSTFDFSIESGADIVVEERDPAEVTHLRGEFLTVAGISAGNPSFDVTPASYITAFITEHGVIQPQDLKRQLRIKK